ncbi:MAG: hypothetical protein ACYDEY_15620 [Acidimicrobiales bacterium]
MSPTVGDWVSSVLSATPSHRRQGPLRDCARCARSVSSLGPAVPSLDPGSGRGGGQVGSDAGASLPKRDRHGQRPLSLARLNVLLLAPLAEQRLAARSFAKVSL